MNIVPIDDRKKNLTSFNAPIEDDSVKKLSVSEYEAILRDEYDIKIGDLFVSCDSHDFGQFYKIHKILNSTRFLEKEYPTPIDGEIIDLYKYNWESIEEKDIPVNTPNKNIKYDEEEDCFYIREWSHYGSLRVKDLLGRVARGEYARISAIEEFQEKENFLADNFHNIGALLNKGVDSDKDYTSTDLMVLNNKDSLKSMRSIYETKGNEIDLLRGIMRKKISELEEIRHTFMTVVDKIRKVIGSIELYLGVKEDIIQIKTGAPAPVDTKLSLRQRILYMDEEVGVVEGGGLDWRNVEDFDDWLIKDKNLDYIIPEIKGIVILRVRRKDKRYTDNPIDNRILNTENKMTYFLIRNGDCVYRIYANVIISGRLFPGRDEIVNISNSYYSKRQVDIAVEMYRDHLLVIQGIIDRSDILKPLPGKINLLNIDDVDAFVNLIYDDERCLGDGHLGYTEWRSKLNSFNNVGSRIIYSGVEWGDDYSWRTMYNHSPKPQIGIYNINRRIEGSSLSASDRSHRFSFKYNPGDTVWSFRSKYIGYRSYVSHGRKRSLTFYIKRDDYCILNYDNLKVEDIDHYINDRRERENYLDMIPLLKQAKKQLLQERDEEIQFANLLLAEYKIYEHSVNYDYYMSLVQAGIEWWKYKVIMKRPLMREDKKAFKMIKSFVDYSIGI